MSSTLRIALNAAPEQAARLEALQSMFAKACNSLAPLVQRTRCWNRVTLHHLAYRGLRDSFPTIGSQMACNVIYSVSRTCRIVYQHPDSPFNVARMADKPLPLVQFDSNSPVYFDRHTLSLKDGALSMFTLDGRMRFQLSLAPEDETRFREQKLREIVLLRRADKVFELAFQFTAHDQPEHDDARVAPSTAMPSHTALPNYVRIEKSA
jgi:hypothetical protein